MNYEAVEHFMVFSTGCIEGVPGIFIHHLLLAFSLILLWLGNICVSGLPSKFKPPNQVNVIFCTFVPKVNNVSYVGNLLDFPV